MSQKNYVGAAFDWDRDEVLVWERDTPEKRTLRRVKAPRYFYVPAENGEYESIFGDRLEKLEFDGIDEWNLALKAYPPRDRHESDIQPMFKVLMNEYYKRPLPVLNFAFVDIETDTKKDIGWSTVANPYAPINAATIYQSWTGKFITLLLAPKGYDVSKFDVEVAAMAKELKLDFTPEFTICVNEVELLMKLVEAIQNADLISGWNSEFFDIPYIMRRLERVTPKLVYKMSFIGAKAPKVNTVMRFGEESIVYKLFGRTHIDYLDLFKKFAQDVRYPTYSLGFVGEAEVGVNKVHFDGHFEEFYNNEFPKFACYNARDVDILVKINQKRKLIQLVNTMAHENTCLFENLLGTVRYVETAIVNRAHYVHSQIVRDKVGLSSDGKVVGGALVLDPYPGLHEWLGSVDINSLYPSVIRALNISPEMMIGQFDSGNCRNEIRRDGSHFVPAENKYLPDWKHDLIASKVLKSKADSDEGEDEDNLPVQPGEYDWAGIKEGDDLEHTLYLSEVGQKILGTEESSLTFTGAEWVDVLHSQKWAITAYGTVFDQSRDLGIIPRSLEAWYSERKALQAEKKKWQEEYDRLKKAKAPKKEIAAALLKVEDFELMQMSKKLTLNSTYGAMLSPHFGLGRKEMGASVTACGRAITKHMIEVIGTQLTGNKIEVTWYNGQRGAAGNGYAFNVKRSAALDTVKREICDVTLLSDTDSCYFKTLKTNKAEAVQRANEIAEVVNDGFPEFMRQSFLCSSEKYDSLIKAGREIVGRRGLFLDAKKKYTIRVVDLDGFEVHKLKMMGSELKKVDTPKIVQDFLKGMLERVLDCSDEDFPNLEDILEKYVNAGRRSLVFKNENQIGLGVAKGINNLENFHAAWVRAGKPEGGKVQMMDGGELKDKSIPGHVRAAMNYNDLATQFEGSAAKHIRSGEKGLIFYVKPNQFGIKSIAIPVDFEHFPPWFEEHFTIDNRLTEAKMIDNKIEGTYHALGWEVPNPQRTLAKKIFEF